MFADEALVYDSRLASQALLEFEVTSSLKKAGVVQFTMPPGHPAYNGFVSLRTLLEVYRDERLIFRGRVLYPSDDFFNRRTITGEGERGFLRDGTMRPYVYQDSPDVIFADVIQLYNSQVDEFKRFEVGEVTVTDANDYIRLESERAEQVADTIDKLVDRCGGYIVFTTNAAGKRVINWLAELNYSSSQAIEFGENLLDYARQDASDELATRIIPYGAKIETEIERTDETTGEIIVETLSEYVTIASENGGLDYIQDDEAVALRGVISRPVYWDDVTEPSNLLAKAEQFLASSKLVITTLELTAVDLSALDKDIDSFMEGDRIRVASKPHRVDEDFLLFERTYNLLNPANDTVVLGKDKTTLTGSDAAGDKAAQNELNKVKQEIIADYQLNTAVAVAEVETLLRSLIEQTSTAIRSEVSETYMTGDELTEYIGTQLTQLSDSFEMTFTTLQQQVDENDAYARDQLQKVEKYIRFVDGDIILGETGNALTLKIENDRIAFLEGGAEVAYITDRQLYITDAHFLHSLRLGNFAFMPRQNGNLSLVKVG
ncbi:MAG: phage tail protein [Alistipes sp.]|nr:phage tail protein [Alistipes sp.]